MFCVPFQIEISETYSRAEWGEDIKKVLRMAGEANKPVVFLFADTQIKDESFVEDISNLLNTYEVRIVSGRECEHAIPPFMADISNLLYTSPPRCPT